LILVDTGINWEQAHEHDRYYKGILHYVLNTDEYLLTREQELPAQVERLGYRCEVRACHSACAATTFACGTREHSAIPIRDMGAIDFALDRF
jgi:hypothetical protein